MIPNSPRKIAMLVRDARFPKPLQSRSFLEPSRWKETSNVRASDREKGPSEWSESPLIIVHGRVTSRSALAASRRDSPAP